MAPRAALAGLRPGFLLAPEPYFAHAVHGMHACTA
jgi:hypothetical protein